ncbi:hypothetical protein PR048_013183 [Dryococelus australis]|uniref:Uncharacterized protein n=1 Tax=Dryococelus australis TaxID=614101 RepID=A0ABQ9HRG2_9NEOP|nr:hypothetical protein PR048_013183 [Dryococelus australis]
MMDRLVKPIKKLWHEGNVANNWLQWKTKFKYYHEAIVGCYFASASFEETQSYSHADRTAEVTSKYLEKFHDEAAAVAVQEVKFNRNAPHPKQHGKRVTTHQQESKEQWQFQCDGCGKKNTSVGHAQLMMQSRQVREMHHEQLSLSSSSSEEDMIVAEVECAESVPASSTLPGTCDCVDSLSNVRIEPEWTAKVEVMNTHFINVKLDTPILFHGIV